MMVTIQIFMLMNMSNLKNKTKSQLIEMIETLEETMSEMLSDYEREGFNRGYDAGRSDTERELTRYISNSELSDYPNVLRFG